MVVTAPDLIDRTAIVGMGKPFEEEKEADRETKCVLEAKFQAVRRKLLGCILIGVSEGLRHRRAHEPVPKPLPRMDDFAEWTYRCEAGLGWERGTIMKVYREALTECAADIAELDTIASGLLRFMLENPDGWRGSIAMLGAHLNRMDGGRATELFAATGARMGAHNIGFDAVIWDRLLVPAGWPVIPLDRWDCTAFRCRLARLPAGLGQAAACLGLPPKDEAGKKLVLSLSNRDLTANPITDAERAIADAYVRQDTELCRLIDRRVPKIPEQWRAVFEFDYELNERGLPLDVPTIEKLLVVRDAETKRLQAQFATLTDGGLASPKQNKKLKAKLATLGVNLSNLQHDTLV